MSTVNGVSVCRVNNVIVPCAKVGNAAVAVATSSGNSGMSITNINGAFHVSDAPPALRVLPRWFALT